MKFKAISVLTLIFITSFVFPAQANPSLIALHAKAQEANCKLKNDVEEDEVNKDNWKSFVKCWENDPGFQKQLTIFHLLHAVAKYSTKEVEAGFKDLGVVAR